MVWVRNFVNEILWFRIFCFIRMLLLNSKIWFGFGLLVCICGMFIGSLIELIRVYVFVVYRWNGGWNVSGIIECNVEFLVGFVCSRCYGLFE